MNVCCVKVTVPNFLRYPLFWVLGDHWSLPPAPPLRDISPSYVPPSRDFNFTASCGGCCCGLCDHSAPGHFSSYVFSLLPPRPPPLLIRPFHLCRFFHHPLFPEEHKEKLMKICKHHHQSGRPPAHALELCRVSEQTQTFKRLIHFRSAAFQKRVCANLTHRNKYFAALFSFSCLT